VDIRLLDEVAIADDSVMRDFYELSRRAELLDRPHATFWTFEELVGAYRSVDSGERQQLFAAYDGDRMVACAPLWFPLLDNTEKAYFSLDVDLPDRRRGIGRAVLQRLEQEAAADGRTLMLTDTKLPFAERDGHGYVAFAEVCGYAVANHEVIRHLELPVADEVIQGWIDETAPRRDGYTIETFVDEVPEELVASLCSLMGQLAVDAPSGAVDYEEEVMTPERFAEGVAAVKAMGRARYETVALTPDREVAAHSTLAVPRGDGTTVYQWGTFVHREHRGHRLGLATKAVNLRAAQAFREDLTLVTTQNAETNDFMVSINEQMGFRPVEVSVELYKHL
jgi:GNAT superfamily N-acetyltransferase